MVPTMGTLGLLAAKCDFSSGTKSHRAAPVTFGELGWGASGKGALKTRGGARPASLSSFCMEIRTYEYGLRNDLIVSRHMVVDEIDHRQHLPGSAAGLKGKKKWLLHTAKQPCLPTPNTAIW